MLLRIVDWGMHLQVSRRSVHISWDHSRFETLAGAPGLILTAYRVKNGGLGATFKIDFGGPPVNFLPAVSNRQYVNTYCTNNNRRLLSSRRSNRKTTL